jgi:hypothetical protein
MAVSPIPVLDFSIHVEPSPEKRDAFNTDQNASGVDRLPNVHINAARSKAPRAASDGPLRCCGVPVRAINVFLSNLVIGFSLVGAAS